MKKKNASSIDSSVYPDMDVLVLWEKDSSKIVVSSTDLIFDGDLRRGSNVSMTWEDDIWQGTVLDVEDEEPESDADSDDDNPLANYVSSVTKRCVTVEHIWVYMLLNKLHLDWMQYHLEISDTNIKMLLFAKTT